MSTFTYTIGEKTVQLASVITPRRISEYCAIFGKTKLSELIAPKASDISAAASGMSHLLLDAMGDAKLAQRILSTCTESTFTEEEAADVDSELIGRIATDFFLLLIVKYFGQGK